MKKIVVNDTNVFIDLFNVGLLEGFFSLPWEIHTTDHHGLGLHYHVWKDGHPLEAEPLTQSMKNMVNEILNFK